MNRFVVFYEIFYQRQEHYKYVFFFYIFNPKSNWHDIKKLIANTIWDTFPAQCSCENTYGHDHTKPATHTNHIRITSIYASNDTHIYIYMCAWKKTQKKMRFYITILCRYVTTYFCANTGNRLSYFTMNYWRNKCSIERGYIMYSCAEQRAAQVIRTRKCIFCRIYIKGKRQSEGNTM